MNEEYARRATFFSNSKEIIKCIFIIMTVISVILLETCYKRGVLINELATDSPA